MTGTSCGDLLADKISSSLFPWKKGHQCKTWATHFDLAEKVVHGHEGELAYMITIATQSKFSPSLLSFGLVSPQHESIFAICCRRWEGALDLWRPLSSGSHQLLLCRFERGPSRVKRRLLKLRQVTNGRLGGRRGRRDPAGPTHRSNRGRCPSLWVRVSRGSGTS